MRGGKTKSTITGGRTSFSPKKRVGFAIDEEENMQSNNPAVYFDRLPQPFRFIDQCLQDLIVMPAMEQITRIEDKKRTPEYEGFLKEIFTTGTFEVDGICATTNVHTDTAGSRVLLGDKFGNLMLLDAARKILLDKKEVFPGRRVEHISCSSMVWTDTRLIFVAVVCRAVPEVRIYAFKYSDNKVYELAAYSIVRALLHF